MGEEVGCRGRGRTWKWEVGTSNRAPPRCHCLIRCLISGLLSQKHYERTRLFNPLTAEREKAAYLTTHGRSLLEGE